MYHQYMQYALCRYTYLRFLLHWQYQIREQMEFSYQLEDVRLLHGFYYFYGL